jgi:hypothetical protein
MMAYIDRLEMAAKNRDVIRCVILFALCLTALGLFDGMSLAQDALNDLKGNLRLKSGGLTSQLSPDGLSSGISTPVSPRNAPPSQWNKNIDVSPNTNEQDEPTIAVSPLYPSNIVVGNHEREGPAAPAAIVCAFQASFDAGATWTRFGSTPLQGPLFPAANGHSCSDSVLTADSTGNFYFGYLDIFRFTDPLRVDILVTKSTDDGQSFPTSVVIAKGLGSGVGAEDPDKEWVEADRHPQSPFQGSIYVSYSDFDTFTIKVRKSVDGGATFQPPTTSFGTVVSDVGSSVFSAPFACGVDTCINRTTRYMQGSNISVAPNGDVYVFYGDFTDVANFTCKDPPCTATTAYNGIQMTAAKIMVAKSTDGGLTWTRTVVNNMCSPGPCRSAGTDAHETKNTPAFRVGTFPFGGTSPDGNFVYATWGEYNSVNGSASSFDAGTGRDFAVSDGDIKFARSTDGGATWEPAIRINDDATTNDQFFPAMAVQPEGGLIHVIWFDRRLDPDGINYDVFYATSSNNGRSFKSNIRVTTASSNPRGTSFIGDYIDIDGESGPFNMHAVWTDRRSVATSASSAANDVLTAERLMPPP